MILAPLLALLVTLAPPPSSDTPPRVEAQNPLPTQVSTQELRTPRFRILYTPRAESAAVYLSRDLEQIRDDIARLLGRDWPGVTTIRLGMGRDEYEALALPQGRPPSWAIALAYPGQNLVLGEARALLEADGPLTLRHELVHAALGQFSTRWPRWFQEGLAQSLTGERQWRLEHVATLTRAVTQGRIFFFDDLATGFPMAVDDVEIAYAQSVAFVEFLRRRHGPVAFERLLTRMEQGDEFEKSFGVAFGLPLSMEESAFREELPRKYPWWPLLLSGGTALWVFTSGLLILAWYRRRGAVKALRAEQLRVETVHEAVSMVLRVSVPANDDAVPETGLIDAELLPQRPWRVSVVFAYSPEGASGAPSSQTKHLRAPG